MIIYDLEIKKAIQSRNEPMLPGVEYCNGWTDYEGMGIAVLAAYDTIEKKMRVFTDTNKDGFFRLIDRDPVLVGFNSINFDNRVIEACWGMPVPREKCYDILHEIWAAVGLGPTFSPRTHGGYGLDVCCSVNFGLEKSGNGAFAPIEWQRGNVGHVVDYCVNDVHMTTELMRKIVKDGFIKNPKNPNVTLSIKKPSIYFPKGAA